MILAAGAGTRLRPITESIPKALVEVRGRPMLARVLDRLIEAGATRVIVNVHHHEEQVRTFLRDNGPPGVEIVVSPEPGGPYDTGGGVFAAAPLFRSGKPFLLHNVDVISTIPLIDLVPAHQRKSELTAETPIASVAVLSKEANRKLLFDEMGLMGWKNTGSDRAEIGAHHVRDPVGDVEEMAFTGIHVIEPEIFDLSERTGTFSIISLYLELAAAGHRILPIDVSGHQWIDIGTREKLEEAERLSSAGRAEQE